MAELKTDPLALTVGTDGDGLDGVISLIDDWRSESNVGDDQSGDFGQLHSDVSVLDWSGSDRDAGFPADPASAWDVDDSGFHADGPWDSDVLFPVDDLGDQDSDSLASGLGEALDYAEIEALSDFEGYEASRKRAPAPRLNRVTWEDWDDPVQQKLVRLLRARVEVILGERKIGPVNDGKKTNSRAMGDSAEEVAEEVGDESTTLSRRYLEWIYSRGAPGEELGFETLVEALGGDADEIRLRLQSYLYMRWRLLAEPITGFFVAQPPASVMAKCLYVAGFPGQDAARRIWEHPGIPAGRLIQSLVDGGMEKESAESIVELLSESRMVLEQGNNLYLVGHYGYQLESRSH